LTMRHNALYTIAFDPPDSRRQRRMAALFITSLLRTGYSGEIIVFKNQESPILPGSLPRVREIAVDSGPLRGELLAERATAFKFEAMNRVPETPDFKRIMFADCDHLALRNIEPLFDRAEELTWVEERGSHISWPCFRGYLTEAEMASSQRPGSNSGLWSVRGTLWSKLATEFRRIAARPPVVANKFWGDQPAWNRMLFEGKFEALPYSLDQIQFPLAWDSRWNDYIRATLLHFAGGVVQAKWWLMSALFTARFEPDAALRAALQWASAQPATSGARGLSKAIDGASGPLRRGASVIRTPL
jgi:hypothetical protein